MKIQVQFFKEGDTFIAYAPALDLSTYGKDMATTQQRVKEAVEIFIEEVTSKGNLIEVLKDLGWTKVEKTLNPPVFIGSEVVDMSEQVNG